MNCKRVQEYVFQWQTWIFHMSLEGNIVEKMHAPQQGQLIPALRE